MPYTINKHCLYIFSRKSLRRLIPIHPFLWSKSFPEWFAFNRKYTYSIVASGKQKVEYAPDGLFWIWTGWSSQKVTNGKQLTVSPGFHEAIQQQKPPTFSLHWTSRNVHIVCTSIENTFFFKHIAYWVWCIYGRFVFISFRRSMLYICRTTKVPCTRAHTLFLVLHCSVALLF